MLRAVADTHAVIWYIFADPRLSATARTTIEQIAIEGNQIGFSSITLAEIVYLSERGRINADTLDRLLAAVDSEDALLVEIPFERNIALTLRQVDRSQIPDLPIA
ncbi:MAG: PIN domain-containing protein [Microcoleus sp.]